MSDKLLEMESFVRIVAAGTISAAADQLAVTKSVVSKRLSDLEARLGVQLLARTTRSLNITDSGRAFLENAKEILSAVENAESIAVGSQSSLQGNLRIAAPLSFGLLHLNRAIHEFLILHPAVSIDIDLSDSQIDLVHGGYDVALRIAKLGDSRLVARPLTRIRHTITASPAYLSDKVVPRKPRDLLGLDCLQYSGARDSRWMYTDPGGRKGSVDPNSLLRANNGEFLRDMAIAGSGVVNQPTFLVYKAICMGELVSLLSDYTWRELTAYAVYPKTRYLPRRVRAFIDFLVAYFDRQYPYWDVEIANAAKL